MTLGEFEFDDLWTNSHPEGRCTKTSFIIFEIFQIPREELMFYSYRKVYSNKIMFYFQCWLLSPLHNASARSSYRLWDSHHGQNIFSCFCYKNYRPGDDGTLRSV